MRMGQIQAVCLILLGVAVVSPAHAQAPCPVGSFFPGPGLKLTTNGLGAPILSLDSLHVSLIGLDVTESGYKDLSRARLKLPTSPGEPDPAECTAATVGEMQVNETAGPRWCLQVRDALDHVVYRWRGLTYVGESGLMLP